MKQPLLKYRPSFARPFKEKGMLLLYNAVSGADRYFREVAQISASIMPSFLSLMVPPFHSLIIKEFPPPPFFERENPMFAYSSQYFSKVSYSWQKHFHIARRILQGKHQGMFVWGMALCLHAYVFSMILRKQ